jgi:transcriptional regulator with XRE-family HTH domain
MSDLTPIPLPLRLRYAVLIKEWRDYKDLSQASFAKQVGVRRQYMNRLERGTNCSLGTLESILVAIRGDKYAPALKIALAIRVKTMRERRKFSQEDLSEASGMSVQHISKVERAVLQTSLDFIDKLASALGVAGEYLIEGLQGDELEWRLAAVRTSYLKFAGLEGDAVNSGIE